MTIEISERIANALYYHLHSQSPLAYDGCALIGVVVFSEGYRVLYKRVSTNALESYTVLV